MKKKKKVDSFILAMDCLGALGVICIGGYYIVKYPRFDDSFINLFHVILGALVMLKGLEWVPFDKLKKSLSKG